MTEDPQESESEGDSDMEDKEIKNQDVVMLALLKWKINQNIKEIMSCDDALYYATLVHLCFRVELFYRIYNQTYCSNWHQAFYEIKVFLREVP